MTTSMIRAPPHISLFSLPGCSYCAAAKAKLRELKLEYTELRADVFKQRHSMAAEQSGVPTLPLIYVDGTVVGGAEALMALLKGSDMDTDTAAEALRRHSQQQHQQQQRPDLPQTPPEETGAATAAVTTPDGEKSPSSLPSFLLPLSNSEKAALEEAANADQVEQFVSRLYEVRFQLPVPSRGANAAGTGPSVLTFKELHTVLRGEAGVPVADHGMMWCKKRTFVSSELVTAVRRLLCPVGVSRDQIARLCRRLHRHHMIVPYDPKVSKEFKDSDDLWRFIEDHQTDAMNRHRIFEVRPDQSEDDEEHSGTDGEGAGKPPASLTSSAPPKDDDAPPRRNGATVAHELRMWMGALLAKYTSTKHGLVDYFAMAESPEFARFQDGTTELQTVRLSELSRAEKIAFGINTYNTCVLHAYALHGPPSGSYQLYKFFNSIGYEIDGFHYTMNELENGFLRGNRKAVAAWSLPFHAKDPRLATAVEFPDYRIHFALNCGAKSCPPVKVFSVERLDAELQQAANAFLSEVQLQREKKTLVVSKIIDWYAEDFAAPSVVSTLVKHLPKAVAQDCRSIGLENLRLAYSEYDWSTNCIPKKQSAARTLNKK